MFSLNRVDILEEGRGSKSRLAILIALSKMLL